MTVPAHRCGVVAVVGRPNVGKSTLVNALVGQKVAIVSDKPQTTRRDIRAVWTTDLAQIVFTDTPGYHKPRNLLGSRLNARVGDAVAGVDVVVHVVDAAAGVGRGDAYVYEREVRTSGSTAFCAVNKLDAVRGRREVRELTAAQEMGEYDELVPVSARSGQGVGLLRDLILSRMPEGPALFPDAELTDLPLDVRLAESIREKALAQTREEVPHSIAVVVDEIDPGEGLTTVVHASLFVERESQKGILIGSQGRTLKEIGSRAREELELLLGSKVYLDLHVKVMREWQKDPRALERLGL